MAGMTRNVNVHAYLPAKEVIVALMRRLAVVVNVSRAPIGTEHFLCLIPRVFASLCVMKFMLDPVSRSARHWIGCCLLVNMWTWAVVTMSLCNTSEDAGRVSSVLVGVLDFWRHGLRVCVRFELSDELVGEFVRVVPESGFFEVFRLPVGDGGDAVLLLDEEGLRLEVEEFDLDGCFS